MKTGEQSLVIPTVENLKDALPCGAGIVTENKT
jgi:hypothetical protein